MTRQLFVLWNEAMRAKAAAVIASAPKETRVEVKLPKRTLPQNALLWACLTDLSEQVTWHGLKLSADDWKLIMLDGLKSELRLVPNINGNGFVNLGRSSSDLTVGEMADLITLVQAFGANHGVAFGDQRRAA
jgi:hypothetical protein